MINANPRGEQCICFTIYGLFELNVSNNNKSNNGSSDIRSPYVQYSTCNHCWRKKKEKTESEYSTPTYKLMMNKTESADSFSVVSYAISENMSTRQSIISQNGLDNKRRFMLSSNTSKSTAMPYQAVVNLPKTNPTAPAVSTQNPFRHKINTNSSCTLFGTFKHKSISKKSLFIPIQTSNNAPDVNNNMTIFPIESINQDMAESLVSNEANDVPVNPNSEKKVEISDKLEKPKLVEKEVNDDDEKFKIVNFTTRFKEMKNQKRYVFVKILGEGAFGQVIECLDIQRKRLPVAIKVSKSLITTSQKLFNEVSILKKIIQRYDSPYNPCATLVRWFKLEMRLCLVFNRYGDNLYILMKKRQYVPLPLEMILKIAYQLLQACLFLHEKCELIHTDLKPENIVLCSSIYIFKEERGRKVNMVPSKLDIKIIDFGNALSFKKHRYTRMIGTRHYRAVEVVLGLPWNYKIDYWSIGCVLYELYTGKVLFMAKNDAQHLACIDKMIGPIKPEMTKTSAKAHLFHEDGTFNKKCLDCYDAIELKDFIENHFKQLSSQSQMFTNLILNLLQTDPNKRSDMKEALRSYAFTKIPDYMKRKYKIPVYKLTDENKLPVI